MAPRRKTLDLTTLPSFSVVFQGEKANAGVVPLSPLVEFHSIPLHSIICLPNSKFRPLYFSFLEVMLPVALLRWILTRVAAPGLHLLHDDATPLSSCS